jgi:hypothetical protein
MAISKKDEKSLLDHEEWTLVETTHHPMLHDLEQDALEAARKRLRDLRNKERDLSQHKARVVRGKADMRGGSFPGTAERPRRRKQVFAHALRRVNSEVDRRKAQASRTRIVESQRRALAMKRAAPSKRPANTASASSGPAAVENKKKATRTPGAKVGSVSQQGKRAQAKRDS